MKWTNKGHEFDLLWEELKIDKDKDINVYIFGAGVVGREIWGRINRIGHICGKGFIDNNVDKIGQRIDGLKVFGIKDIVLEKNEFVIISVSEQYLKDIEKQLDSYDFISKSNCYIYTTFFNNILPVLLLYKYDYLFEEMSQLSLTEKCTLKCRNCAHTCPYINRNKKNELTIDEAKRSIDYYFAVVDYVEKFTLLGGEPLLYGGIEKIARYLGEQYGDKVGIVTITTNGTIIPSPELLDVCRKYKIAFDISNYSKVVPRVRGKVESLMAVLKEEKVDYIELYVDEPWLDFGFFDVVNDNENTQNVFDGCGVPCHEIRDNKYYSCIMARCAAENIYNDTEVYIDMAQLNSSYGKRVFLEFINGYTENGALKMCRHCRGFYNNSVFVLPGEQL